MTVLQRFVCVAAGIGIVAACSAASGPGSTVTGFNSAGGSSGSGALVAGASGMSTAGGQPSRYVTSPGSGDPSTGPMISTPLPTVDASAGTKCSAVESKGKQVTVDLFIMFDQSKSMSCALPAPSTGSAGAAGAAGAGGASSGAGGSVASAGGAGTSNVDRWDAVKGALQEFVSAPGAAGINVGIQYFGLGGTPSPFGATSSCNASDYQGADVEIAPLPGNAQPIISSLNAHSPTTNTPTPPALTGAINHAIAWKNKNPDHAVVVVLVTDGQPNGCGTVADTVSVAKQGFTSSIPTYVIGVTSPGTTCMWDQNPPNQQDLDSVANAGGTQAALIVDLSMDTSKQFLDTMDKIRARSNPPCQFTLPPAPAGETLDPAKVNVEYTPPGMTVPETLVAVPQMSSCDPTTGGWYYDNPVTPKTVTLCTATCNRTTVDVSGAINIAVGCATKTTK
jgi:hypothetical protein